MRRKKQERRIGYSTKNAMFQEGVSNEAISMAVEFVELLIKLRETACQNTHYDRLDEWMDAVHQHINKALKKFGFKNGDREYNDKFPDIRFWWDIYSMPGDTIYSPHLRTQTANHHSSAYERNEALICGMVDILNFKRPDLFPFYIMQRVYDKGFKGTGYTSALMKEDDGYAYQIRYIGKNYGKFATARIENLRLK